MDRVAVFVDAGYVYAGGSTAISGSSRKRTDLTLDVAAVVTYLSKRAEEISGMKLLRIYWYDGAITNRLSTDQQLLASSDNVKLRLGIVNSFGEQKGVDAKIITDIADLARNKAIAEAVVIGGDEDLRVGVELAQQHGARVHLLTIEGSTSSATLRQEADTLSTISRADIRTFLSLNVTSAPAVASQPPVPAAAAPPSMTLTPPMVPVGGSIPASTATPSVPTSATGTATATAGATPTMAATVPQNVFDEEVKAYLDSLTAAEQGALKSAIQVGRLIPTEHDGRLLVRAAKRIGRPLENSEKPKLRNSLRQQLGV